MKKMIIASMMLMGFTGFLFAQTKPDSKSKTTAKTGMHKQHTHHTVKAGKANTHMMKDSTATSATKMKSGKKHS